MGQRGKEGYMKRIVLTALALTTTSPVFADRLAVGDEILAAIAGNTVQGSMIDAGAYTEFYGADGTIKGSGYTGSWNVKDNQMCFEYGDGTDCWSVRIDGETVTWVKDGEEDGSGMIVSGNPNGF